MSIRRAERRKVLSRWLLANGSYRYLLGGLLLTLWSGCDTEEATSLRLTGIEDAAGELLMGFAYDDCNVVEVAYRRPLIVDTAPSQYPDPLRDLGVSRESIFCTYNGSDLTGITIVDMLSTGERRSRTYVANYSAGRLAGLRLTEELPRRPGTPPDRDLSFFYDARGRVDSILYGSAFSAAFTYDDEDNIRFAQYRDPSRQKATEEYYGYADAAGPNPFFATPLRYVQPYAGYWSSHPVAQATFDLRQYVHTTEAGRVRQSVELTFGDSTAVQRYVYEASACR